MPPRCAALFAPLRLGRFLPTVVSLSPLGVRLVLGLSGNVTWPARNVTYGYIELSIRSAPRRGPAPGSTSVLARRTRTAAHERYRA